MGNFDNKQYVSSVCNGFILNVTKNKQNKKVFAKTHFILAFSFLTAVLKTEFSGKMVLNMTAKRRKKNC